MTSSEIRLCKKKDFKDETVTWWKKFKNKTINNSDNTPVCEFKKVESTSLSISNWSDVLNVSIFGKVVEDLHILDTNWETWKAIKYARFQGEKNFEMEEREWRGINFLLQDPNMHNKL